MKTSESKTVVFVTGAFVTNQGWKHWQEYFEANGYKTLAPAWPHKEGAPEDLRKSQPNDIALAKLTLTEVVDHYAQIVKSLPEKPILIGHSLGGLVSQILLNRDLAAGAVVIHSVPPLGVIPFEFSFLKAGWKSLGLFTSLDKTYLMSFKDWQYAFTNGMSLEDQKKAYDENTIPESKRVARGGLTPAAKVDFRKPHAPLLFVAGSTDNIIPATLNKRNYNRYTDKASVTDFQLFEGNNHYVTGLPTWGKVAGFALNWINQH